MAGLNETLNWLIPTVLLLVAGGFVYTKFFQPFVLPMLSGVWEWISSKSDSSPKVSKGKREISFE